ncbi:alpha/beta hydrolase [uncultured Tateyamaria sp.]|uniref:alpha/beta fold hydrolase n=1 Tax=uncultured Tateyamaria sp. TaxID=455651 RepID=UPI00262DA100|nr:alpha/beta hydrolase [uncultured Tateyamaria sp.]
MIPVVFVHGFMGGSRQWQSQVEALAGVETYSVDLPGFGENAHIDGLDTIAGFSDWVLADLKSKGITHFHLVGHSMGGMIAQEMISQSPDSVDRLVLYGTGAQGVLPGRFETIATSKQRALSDGPHATARRIAATWFLNGDTAGAYETCAAIAERSSIQAILAGLDAMSGWTGVSKLPSFMAKTLVVWGDHDRTYPWTQTEELWRSIPKASLAVIPDCAHAAHLEKPRIFNDIVKDFLTG